MTQRGDDLHRPRQLKITRDAGYLPKSRETL